MPNVNGLDLLRRLQETPHKGVPVIMVTTEGGEKTVLEAISLGAKGFVRKPFTAEQMEAALHKAMSG
jgi:two-component system chemotaxis response regulator CheY